MIKRVALLALIALCFVLPAFGTGSAEPEAVAEYPSRPIRIIVPYNAGGGTDTHARLLARALEDILPVPVVIVNMGGGAGAIGSREVLEAEPDGYTVMINIVNVWTNVALGNTEFGPLEFEPVAEAGTFYLVETTGAQSRYNTFRQVLDDVRNRPGTVRIATNIGAITHFTSLGVQQQLGGNAEFNMVHIGDGAQRIANVLGGHVDLTIMSTAEALPYYRSGEMRVLAVYAPERIEGLPDVPTAAEQGLNYVQPSPYWLFMPPGTPQDRVDYLADAIEKVMTDPEMVRRFTEMTMIPTFKQGAELRATISEQGERLLNLAEVYDLGQ